MEKGWEGTFYEELKSAPESERRYYVYMWFERNAEDLIPFYVGMGSGSRAYRTSGRSKALLNYIEGRKIEKKIVAPNLTYLIALRLEEELKKELKARGYKIIDAEDSKAERKRRQEDGIKAMPVDDEGYKVSSRTGRRFGRESVEVDLTLLEGETISEACERLGISRSTYYRKLKMKGMAA